MQKTITYTVLVGRHNGRYVARCPAYPELTSAATNRRQAYRSIKQALRAKLLARLLAGDHLAADPIVTVKHLRIDMVSLRMESDLL